ncbi:MAG: HlyD family secretion protein, partial [Sphingomonadales bacterium]
MSQNPDPHDEAEGHGALGNEFVPADGPARRSRLRRPLLLAAPIVAIIAALFFYLHGGRYETTDNASLQAGQVSISPSINGTVIAVEVRENQAVRPGQVLFRIDPAPYQAAVAEAEAQLADARTQIAATRAQYRQSQSEIQAARDKLTFAVREAARQKELLAEGISSQAQYDQAVLAARTARQGIQTTQHQAESVRASLSGNVDAPAEAQPAVQRAKAALDRARINLGHTTVRAMQAGIVTKVNQLQVGNYVSASKPVFMLVGQRIWVEANFKENQLRYMRLGQPATVKIDAYPDYELRARLTSFSPGTGNSFSLLPAENATGNWVKVVQRLPVELTLLDVPDGLPLHAGLSAEVTV